MGLQGTLQTSDRSGRPGVARHDAFAALCTCMQTHSTPLTGSMRAAFKHAMKRPLRLRICVRSLLSNRFSARFASTASKPARVSRALPSSHRSLRAGNVRYMASRRLWISMGSLGPLSKRRWRQSTPDRYADLFLTCGKLFRSQSSKGRQQDVVGGYVMNCHQFATPKPKRTLASRNWPVLQTCLHNEPTTYPRPLASLLEARLDATQQQCITI